MIKIMNSERNEYIYTDHILTTIITYLIFYNSKISIFYVLFVLTKEQVPLYQNF